MENKTIVCLANSLKPPDGRCIAGREWLGNGYGSWIRPISHRPTAEVCFSECRYADNSSPQLLDIIEIPVLRAQPTDHQTENHVIDAKRRWTKKGQMHWQQLEILREYPESLWINSDSTAAGRHDRMGRAEASTLRHSLLLI